MYSREELVELPVREQEKYRDFYDAVWANDVAKVKVNLEKS